MNDKVTLEGDAQVVRGAAEAAIALARRVLAWCDCQVREALREAGAEQAIELDSELDRLQRLLPSLEEEQAICFLGNSGVGKSTLINALVAGKDRVLPQGGIGPLTAQATSVRYAEHPYFEVSYLSPKILKGMLLALEGAHHRARGTAATASDLALDDDAESLVDPTDHDDDDSGPSDRMQALQKQTRLLVQGNQNGDIDLPYLIDGLRRILGYKPRWGTEPTAADATRITQARPAVEHARAGRRVRVDLGTDPAAFRAHLEAHASGALAPLIQTLEVGWNSPLLAEGLVLVDLPGLGVANDEYRAVTHEWVREKARAIVLVVDRSGVKEAEADLLHSTGFLNRLMFSADDPSADPVELLLVAVKIDLTAYDDWRNERNQLGRESARPWIRHFEHACERARTLMQGQVAEALRQAISTDPKSDLRHDIDAVITALLERSEFHAVSATQHVSFLTADEDDPPKIRAAQESGIPQLMAALGSVARRRRAELERRVYTQALDLCLRARAHLDVVKVQWEGDARIESEAQQLRAELDEFLVPLRRELSARQGAFREFLRQTVPVEIEAAVGKARTEAEKEIRAYLHGLRNAHWMTLRAAVRRGGTFIGAKHIDLPVDFALRFEEPVALIWAKRILAALRKRTAELGDDYVQMVGEVAKWADQQGARVQPKLVRALREQMATDAKQLADVGKEKINELRAAVKNSLLKKIEAPIRTRCQAFVRAKKDEGIGTKGRILELFDRLAELVADAAQPAATEILRENFSLVEGEIRDAIRKFEDPLSAAADAIVSSHAQRLRRSDRERRGTVLALVDRALSEAPCPASADDGTQS